MRTIFAQEILFIGLSRPLDLTQGFDPHNLWLPNLREIRKTICYYHHKFHYRHLFLRLLPIKLDLVTSLLRGNYQNHCFLIPTLNMPKKNIRLYFVHSVPFQTYLPQFLAIGLPPSKCEFYFRPLN